MSEQNKSFLGWGLLGTPSGRQFSNAGADKHLNLAKTVFDLSQDLGGCLPSPKSGDNSVLYALIFREVNNEASVVGLASYYSIFEQGQTRAGTYFGSFIESVNSVFTIESLPAVYDVLSKLNNYQVKNFIDWENKSYRTNNIANAPFDEPQELNNIQLQKLGAGLNWSKPADFLFIHCQAGEADKVIQTLLKTQLYRQFKDIYFTESAHISAEMRKMNRLQISSAQLVQLETFVAPWKGEIQGLYSHIQKLNGEYQAAQKKIKELNDSRDAIIKQQVEEKTKERAESYKKQRDEAEKRAEENEKFAKIGQASLSQFSGLVADKVASKVISDLDLDHHFRNLSAKLNHIQPQPKIAQTQAQQPQEQAQPVVTSVGRTTPEKSTLATRIWMTLSVVLLGFLLGIGGYFMFTSNVSLSQEEHKKLKDTSNKVSQMEKQLEQEKKNYSKLKDEKDKLNDENDGLKKKIETICQTPFKENNKPEACKP